MSREVITLPAPLVCAQGDADPAVNSFNMEERKWRPLEDDRF
jgi:hypothetical protein